MGIYLGWRGKSGSIPGLNLVTFYNRSGAARRIAGTSSTEVIYRILSTTMWNPEAGVILMGHSLGGLYRLSEGDEGIQVRLIAEHLGWPVEWR